MRAGLGILCLSIALIGCGQSQTPLAYVDVEQVASTLPLGFVEPSPNPLAPAPAKSSRVAIEPIPARRLDFSANKARLEKVKAAVDEARERTVRDVARKLRDAYQREIDLIETRRMAMIPDVRAAALAKAWIPVRARFEAYANARAPHAIRVALYAGFPDPDPSSLRTSETRQNALTKRAERTRTARAALQQLDEDYESDVRKLLAGYDDEVASSITEIRIEIEKMRGDAEERARNDALAQAAQEIASIESVLSASATVDLPSAPGTQSVTPEGQPLAEAPIVEFPSRAEAIRHRLEAVRSEARIWAAHRGVRLIESPRRGADRTDEFIAWRKERHLGP